MFRWIGSVSLLGLVGQSIACDSSKGFVSAVGTVINGVGDCTGDAKAGLAALGGAAASSCNQAQMAYAGLSSVELAGYAARCHCKEAYYDKVKTLADVDLWTDCIGPVNILIVESAKATRDYQAAHAKDIFATCNVCTDSVFPPVDPNLEQIQTALDFALDWKGKLMETETNMLKEGVQAVVVAAALGNGVPNGAPSPSVNFVVSSITGASAFNKRDTNSTSGLIKDILNVKVQLLMVPVNGSMNRLAGQLKSAFSTPQFTSNLTVWNAKMTGSTFTPVRGFQSANSTSGTSTSTSTNSSAVTSSGSAPSSSKTGEAASLAPVTVLSLCALVFCLLQMI